jgi:MFS transporter, ACS family, hexuronate transporter
VLPTARRWIPALSMLLVSLISYIDRNTLALLAPTILRDTRMTAEQYGFVISAFSVVYMAANPVWGRWLDRVGLRAGMLLAVAIWTMASVSHAFATGFLSFALARAALGFGEGATFPGGLRTVVQTLPTSQRSRGVAVAFSGGSLGAVVTPLIVTPIALWWGWRAAFLFTGFIGLAWILLWLGVSRFPEMRRPSDLEDGPDDPASVRLNDPRVWAAMCAYAFGALPLAFVIYGAALYLSRELGKSQAVIGQVLWLPPLGWEIGYFFWGWLADRAARAGRPPVPALRRLMGAAMFLSLPLAVTPWLRSFPLAMLEMFFAMFAAAGFIILPVAYATQVFSSKHAGLIAGLCAGAWSAAVAVIMPVFGRLFDRGRFDASFLLAAGLPVVGYLLWLRLSRAGHEAPGSGPLR